MRLVVSGITMGCTVVLVGLIGVLVAAWMVPVTGVDSFERFIFVGGATGIPYSFGVLVGVSAVYHARRRGRFLAAAGVCAAIALGCVYAASGADSMFSPTATSVSEHLFAAVITVWVFLPLVGLFFGALAVTVGRRSDGQVSMGPG